MGVLGPVPTHVNQTHTFQSQEIYIIVGFNFSVGDDKDSASFTNEVSPSPNGRWKSQTEVVFTSRIKRGTCLDAFDMVTSTTRDEGIEACMTKATGYELGFTKQGLAAADASFQPAFDATWLRDRKAGPAWKKRQGKECEGQDTKL